MRNNFCSTIATAKYQSTVKQTKSNIQTELKKWKKKKKRRKRRHNAKTRMLNDHSECRKAQQHTHTNKTGLTTNVLFRYMLFNSKSPCANGLCRNYCIFVFYIFYGRMWSTDYSNGLGYHHMHNARFAGTEKSKVVDGVQLSAYLFEFVCCAYKTI